MDTALLIPLVALFVSVAVVAAAAAWLVLTRYSPERRRLQELRYAGAGVTP